MESNFEIAYKAFCLNNIEASNRKESDSYNHNNRHALKIPDTEIDYVIELLKAGRNIRDIWKEKYQTVCKEEAIRKRVREKGFSIKDMKKEKKWKQLKK